MIWIAVVATAGCTSGSISSTDGETGTATDGSTATGLDGGSELGTDSGIGTGTDGSATIRTDSGTAVGVDCSSTRCFYVRDGASGDGSSWSSAYRVLPDTLERGAVYFVADGSYPAYLFDDPASGTTMITIKKATIADHGSDVGWLDTYGDGQANWSAPLKFRTGFYAFDGSTRNEGDWFDGEAYGFKVTAVDHHQQIKIGGIARDGSYDYYGAPGAHGVHIRHTFVQATAIPVEAVRSYQIDVESSEPTTDVVIHRCYVKDGNNHFFLRNTIGAIVEYSAAEDARSNSNNHGESVNLYYSTPGAVIRHNVFRNLFPTSSTDYGGTAVIAIVISPDVSIYGNVFINNNVTDGLVGWTGDRPEYAVSRLRFFNNTIIGGRGGAQTPMLEYHSVDCRAYNNLWIDSRVAWDSSMTHDYNAYSGTSTYGEPNGQADVPSSIFVDHAGGDLRLAEATAPGLPLEAPYDQDRLGRTRGADGVWDRGAFELDNR